MEPPGAQAGMMGRGFRATLLLTSLAAMLLLAGCNQEQSDKAIGEGHVGTANAVVRDRLGAGSSPIASLKAGERVEILQRRRRWVRVRVPGKIDGWVDERAIIAPEEFEKFQALVKASEGRPSEGRAKAFDAVNLHLEPSRKSPVFYQLAEGEECDLMEHRAVPKPLPPGLEPVAPAASAEGQAAPGQQPPEAGAAPAAEPPKPEPKRPAPRTGARGKKKQKPKPTGPPMEDWFLVRGNAKAGWAVARMIEMTIPDEVAQYSEGKAITAWKVLDEVLSGGEKKAQYVWATSDQVGSSYDFTGIRVFTWNPARKHYETAYRERNLKGVYPLAVSRVRLANDQEVPMFAVTALNAAGEKVAREFVLLGNRVRRRDQAQ